MKITPISSKQHYACLSNSEGERIGLLYHKESRTLTVSVQDAAGNMSCCDLTRIEAVKVFWAIKEILDTDPDQP